VCVETGADKKKPTVKYYTQQFLYIIRKCFCIKWTTTRYCKKQFYERKSNQTNISIIHCCHRTMTMALIILNTPLAPSLWSQRSTKWVYPSSWSRVAWVSLAMPVQYTAKCIKWSSHSQVLLYRSDIQNTFSKVLLCNFNNGFCTAARVSDYTVYATQDGAYNMT